MVTLVAVDTGKVVTLKVAVDFPAPTVMVAGTLATFGLSLVRETTTPPLGAGALSVTVPMEVPPPTRVVGSRVSEDKAMPALAV